jgi:hypothetical protein
MTFGLIARLADWGCKSPGYAPKGRTRAVIGCITSTIMGAPKEKRCGNNSAGI